MLNDPIAAGIAALALAGSIALIGALIGDAITKRRNK